MKPTLGRGLAAITFLALLLPLRAFAQPIELTLNCKVERSWDVMKDQQSEMTGSFSAIIHMQKDGTQTATIEATTPGCFSFVGAFSELEVSGDCERNGDKFTLTINRITGEFKNVWEMGNSLTILSGRCIPATKLF